MKAVCFIFLFLFCSLSSYAQVIGFEEKVPETFKVSGKGEVKLSSLFYKEEKAVWNGISNLPRHWTFR